MRTVLLALLVLAVAGTAPAGAATVTLSYEPPVPGLEPDAAYGLAVMDRAGEANQLWVRADAGAYTVTDFAVPLKPGEGCEALSANEARCPMTEPADQHSVFVDGGDGHDRIVLGSLHYWTDTELHGGAGNDQLLGGSGHELLFGGPGDDAIGGGSGFDKLDGGPGDDVLVGGDGFDRASYQSRRRPVVVDMAAGTGGERGERDTLRELEEVVGGRAADRLFGDSGPNTLVGGEGHARDVLRGRGGDDVLVGYRGIGGPGDDSLDVQSPSCGSGADALYRGLFKTRGPFPRACETVLGVFIVLKPDPVRRSRRRMDFAVRCRGERCKGRLRLADRRGKLGSAHFSFERATDDFTMRRVRIRLSRRPSGRVGTLRISGQRAYHRDRLRTRLR